MAVSQCTTETRIFVFRPNRTETGKNRAEPNRRFGGNRGILGPNRGYFAHLMTKLQIFLDNEGFLMYPLQNFSRNYRLLKLEEFLVNAGRRILTKICCFGRNKKVRCFGKFAEPNRTEPNRNVSVRPLVRPKHLVRSCTISNVQKNNKSKVMWIFDMKGPDIRIC